jgi:glycerol-3-phosphate dehydrogenase
LYDLLAGKHRIGKHRKLSRKQLIELEPQLKKEGLQGGVSYYDAQMDDTRLCLENILCAAKQKATVANYAEVISFIKENGRVVGAQIKDVLSSDKKLYSLRAKHIVVASGAWTDEVLKKVRRRSSCLGFGPNQRCAYRNRKKAFQSCDADSVQARSSNLFCIALARTNDDRYNR